LVILPNRNLISNISFLSDATHTISHNDGEDNALSCRKLEGLEFPLKHPKDVKINFNVEKEIYKNRYNVQFPNNLLKSMKIIKIIIGSLISEKLKGYIDYFRFPEKRDTWGGAFNGQIGRADIFHDIISIVSPALILETGTFLGSTAAFFAESGLPVVTIESLPRNYGFARARLRQFSNVDLRLGDSRVQMRHALGAYNERIGRPIFAYLDAHWKADLPLAEEIQIIFSHCPDAVVMIDDFQVPDDPGYAYDDYGPRKALIPEYVAPAVQKFDLAQLYPTLSSVEETGARRGSMVLANKKRWADSLTITGLLRTIPEFED
jgi:hypothetical protein